MTDLRKNIILLAVLKFRKKYKVLGRHYDFKNEEDGAAWYKDGGLDKCPMVCATAARLAAEIILDLQKGR